MSNLSDKWSNLAGEVKKRIVSAIFFMIGMIILLFGISTIPSYYAVPLVLVGIVITIVGVGAIVCCLIDWWEDN